MAHGVFAASFRSTSAFLARYLHQTLFAAAANNVRIAWAFLHRKWSQEDWGNFVSSTIFFEDRNIFRARLERATMLCKGGGEWLGNDVFHGNIGRMPTSSFEATVQPVYMAIGSRKCRNLFCRQNIRNRCIAQDIDILVARAPPQVLPDLRLMIPEVFVSLSSRATLAVTRGIKKRAISEAIDLIILQ